MATIPQDDEGFAGVSSESAEQARSSLTVLRHVIVNLTQVVEDGTELVGASVREELVDFRRDFTRHALSLVAVVLGGVLLSAGLAMLVSDWIGSWPITLLIFGAVYLAFAAGLQLGRSGSDTEG